MTIRICIQIYSTASTFVCLVCCNLVYRSCK